MIAVLAAAAAVIARELRCPSCGKIAHRYMWWRSYYELRGLEGAPPPTRRWIPMDNCPEAWT